jgi:CO/xanthine dehydrogenase FAD-binding subunit
LAAAAVLFDASGGKFRNVRIGAIGVADTPLRLVAVERLLENSEIGEAAIAKAEKTAAAAFDPADDIHASGAYRKTLIGVMVERALRDAIYRADG